MSQKSTKVRDTAIDAIKGLLVLLIVLAHNTASDPFILKFTHPAMIGIFFIVSGYLFSTKRGLVQKLRGILLPFCFFVIVSILWRYLYGFISHEPLLWWQWLMEVLSGTDWGLNIPMWFLLSLAEIISLIVVLTKYVHERYARFSIALVGMFVGLKLQNEGISPLYISRSLAYVPFFLIGTELKSAPPILPHGKYPLLTMAAIVAILVARYLYLIDIIWQKWLVDSVLALLIGYLLYNIFKWPHFPSKLFEYFGKNSLVVLCMHILILDVVWRVWWSLCGEPNKFDALLQTIIITLLLVPCCEVYNRYLRDKLK